MDIEATKTLIAESQNCQRNWDTTSSIPQAHMDLLEVAARQCPSKQNYSFYGVKFITNRSIIEQIHNITNPNGNGGHGVPADNEDGWTFYTNPQTLANLLIVFDYQVPFEKQETIKDYYGHENYPFQRDSDVAVGIAMGYLYFVAHSLGYKTGGNACWDSAQLRTILNEDDAYEPAVMLGIGNPDPSKDSREHHTDSTFTFTSRVKENINIEFIE